jgi:hypothetical protein
MNKISFYKSGNGTSYVSQNLRQVEKKIKYILLSVLCLAVIISCSQTKEHNDNEQNDCLLTYESVVCKMY